MNYFDHFATSSVTPIGRWIVRQIKNREFIFIHSYLQNKQAAILEIGAGWGEMAQIIRALGYQHYTAVEPNATMRRELERQGFKSKNYLIPQLDEVDATFDAIILSNVFEHLANGREAQRFVTEARRVLRPGGLLCIACPDYNHWQVDFFNADFSHANITTVRRTTQLFQNNGFSTLGYLYLSSFIHGFPATILSHLVRLGFSFLHSANPDSKFYKIKLSFLRRFLIIGAKQ